MDDKEMLRIIGKNIQKYRNKCGLTQEKLAEKCGFHSTYIEMIERAIRKTSIVSIIKLSKALGVTVNDLVEGI